MVYRSRPDRDNDPDCSGLLFNVLRKRLGFANDRILADWLEISPATMSKIRHGARQVSAEVILRVHEQLGISVADIRGLIAGKMVLK